MSKVRKVLIISLILLFWLIVLLLGAFFLFYFDVVDFEWSKEIKKEYKYEESKSKDTRILILGDSQLEQLIAKQGLFQYLEDYCWKNNFGYANAAHFGFGPIEYLKSLKQVASDYQPNLVIMFYNVQNDLTDVTFRDQEQSDALLDNVFITDFSQDSLAEKSVLEKPEKVEFTIDMNEEVWQEFEDFGIDSEIIQFAKNRVESPTAFGPQYVNPYILQLAMWQSDFLFKNAMLSNEESRFTWYQILQILEEMTDICESIKAKFVIVGIPSSVQVDQSHFDFYRKIKMEVSEELNHSNIPQHLMDTFCAANNVYWIDLLPTFKTKRDSLLYYENDDHLSDFGHKIAFNQLESKILTPFQNNKLPALKGNRRRDFHKAYDDWRKEFILYRAKRRLGLPD